MLGRARIGAVGSDVEKTRLGLTSHLALNVEDRLSILTALELLPSSGGRTAAWYLGARLGSKPTAWIGGVSAVVLGLGALALSGN